MKVKEQPLSNASQDAAGSDAGRRDLMETQDGGTENPRPKTSVVIPAKNEEKNIGWVLSSMPRYVDEVILVDGNSNDGTVEAARMHRPDLVLVGQERPGKGAALREGFAAASGDIVVMIDADGSMDPAEIDKYVAPLIAGKADVVKGSRNLAGGGSTDITPIRSLGNRFLLGLVNGLFGSRFTELCYGFMAFNRRSLSAMNLEGDGFEIETEIVVKSVKAGLKVEEVPSMEMPRRHGCSNLNPLRDGIRILGTIAAVFFRPAGPVGSVPVLDQPMRDGARAPA